MADVAALSQTSSRTSYDAVAAALHWLLAVLIAVTFWIGLTMVELTFSPLRIRLYNWHKWLGVAILVLSTARILWRVGGHPPPPIKSSMPAWQRSALRGTHWAFYGLFFVVPLLGWAYSSAVGVPVVLFGWLPLPDLAARDKAFGDEVLKPLHAASSWLLAAIVVGHTAAACKHHFVDRDDVLARMWPWWPSRPQS